MNNKQAYQAYLQSEQWGKTKAKFRNSKLCKGACLCCGRDGRWDIHHKTYKRLGMERMGDLMELCPVCHKKAHQVHDARPGKGMWGAMNRPQRKIKRILSANKYLQDLRARNPVEYSREVAVLMNVNEASTFVSRAFAPLPTREQVFQPPRKKWDDSYVPY